jgi:hypothetical protein
MILGWWSPGGRTSVVADDQVLVRAECRLLVAIADLEVVGEAADGTQSVELAGRERPRCVAGPVALLSGAALLLGILSMAGEFRHQTVTQTFLVTPDRGRVVAAKLIALARTTLAVTAAVGLGGWPPRHHAVVAGRSAHPRHAVGGAVPGGAGWGLPPDHRRAWDCEVRWLRRSTAGPPGGGAGPEHLRVRGAVEIGVTNDHRP